MGVESSKASGRVYKRIKCEKCSCAYHYELVREARALPFLNTIKMVLCVLGFPLLLILSLFRPISLGGGRTIYLLRYRPADRLRDTLMTTLRKGGDEYAATTYTALRGKLLKGVEPVPCPECGWLQNDMVHDIRSRAHGWLDIVGVGLLGVSQVVGLFAVESGPAIGFRHFIMIWCGWSIVGLGAMFAMMVLRWAVTLKFDPNARHPEIPRPFAGAPPAIRDTEHQKEVAANTAQLLGQIRRKEVLHRRTAILPNALPGK